jgi:hypothetical protein
VPERLEIGDRIDEIDPVVRLGGALRVRRVRHVAIERVVDRTLVRAAVVAVAESARARTASICFSMDRDASVLSGRWTLLQLRRCRGVAEPRRIPNLP